MTTASGTEAVGSALAVSRGSRSMIVPSTAAGSVSILTMWTDSYYEPADVDYDQDDTAPIPELLTAGWWSASSVLDDED